MSTAKTKAPPSRRLLLEGIDWHTYGRLLRVFAEHPSVRLTYDRGRLEIMSPLRKHERVNQFLGLLIGALTEELRLPLDMGGSTTYRRRRKKRGLEPDNSYWIANEPKVRGKDRIDLRVDPPPDLAVEVDVTHSSLDRMAIYAALKVPEAWRFADGVLGFYLLGEDGNYAEGASRSFPGLKAADLLPFLAQLGVMEMNSLLEEFRAWVRQRSADGWK